jgi:hypothetical protein
MWGPPGFFAGQCFEIVKGQENISRAKLHNPAMIDGGKRLNQNEKRWA